MARRQILVQMDDELVDQLDELVQQTGQNRSELIRRAARSLVAGFENVGKDRDSSRGTGVIPRMPTSRRPL